MFLLQRNSALFLFRRSFLLISLVCSSAVVSAGPWIDVGDLRLRNNLELLNDSGALSIGLTTWPVMWADVEKSLNSLDRSKLNAAQRVALRELNFEMGYQTSSNLRRSVEVVGSNSTPLFREFGSFYREKAELRKLLDWQGDGSALRLKANVALDSDDNDVNTDFYGSYFSTVLGGQNGNWIAGIGAIDRWWGAGYQSSLILSNNAEPVPGFFLRTKHSQAFKTPWLSWLGEWQFVSFLGRLESNRAVPEAKLTGMRFTFMPVEGLEIGLSRAMQWGGVGRSDKIKTFWQSLTSQGENESGDAGNQLAGFDARYRLKISDFLSGAVYAQTIGEDEAGYLPARRTIQFGLVLNQALSSASIFKYGLEYTNTTADAFATVFYNLTYEHSAYGNGYRYRGRALGASFDNDTEVISLSASLQNADGSMWGGRASYMQLNEDGVARGNLVSLTAQSVYLAELYHQCFLFGGRLKSGFSYLSNEVNTAFAGVESIAAAVAWEYRY